MNEKPVVSVIIPVYNVQDYVEKCLNSVMNQTLKNIEIIVVDDGSTDRSPSIIDEIAKTDERIRVIHSENGGVSAARNKGLDIARGRYIGFVDSDDYIEPDMYEKMVAVAENNNCDIVQCAFFSGDIDPNNIEREKAGLYNRRQALVGSLNVVGGSVWNKIYSSGTLSGVRFREGLNMGEDRVFAIDSYLRCNSLAVIEDILYHYVLRDGSAVHTGVSRKNIDGLVFFDYLIEEAEGDDEIISLAIREKAGSLIFYLELMIVQKVERSLIDEVENRILEMKNQINGMEFVSIKQKVAFKTLFLSRKLYELMVKTKHLFSRD